MVGRFKSIEIGKNPFINVAVRMPISTWERVKADADYNMRSMNSEVLFLCEKALKDKNATSA